MSWSDHPVPSGICQGAPVLTGRDLRPLQGQVPGADHQRSGLNPTPREVTVDRSHPVHRDHFTQWFRLSLGEGGGEGEGESEGELKGEGETL